MQGSGADDGAERRRELAPKRRWLGRKFGEKKVLLLFMERQFLDYERFVIGAGFGKELVR